ncbi:MAG TPA: ATP-binding protein [Streptosporangiaceae bacterium]|nr:ATP-binding protein [Streptosporangiaceae bacterium]
MSLTTPQLYPAGHRPGAGLAPAAAPQTHQRAFRARPGQVQEARRFLAAILAGTPVEEDAVLCVSELASNCVNHSASGRRGGSFTVRADVRDGDYVWLEVEDEGGRWREPAHYDRMHGLGIVGQLAAELGIAGSEFAGWVVWARLNWPGTDG